MNGPKRWTKRVMRKPLRAALAAFFLFAGPAQAQRLDDATVDCRRGPRILQACYDKCGRKMRATVASNMHSDRVRDIFVKCNNLCWGIEKALEECK